MNIAIGCDHRGFTHKTSLLTALRQQGHEVCDFGSPSAEAVDYPDTAFAVAEAVADGRCDRGILICGSGIGMSIAANKVLGVRASFCGDEEAARLTVLHNDSNVLCLSGDRTPPDLALQITTTWLNAEFEGGRHGRRVQKILDYETATRREGKRS